MINNKPLLDIRDLRMYYPVYKGVLKKKVAEVKAVDGVSLQVGKGETVGLVGESGSGKSTLAKCIVQLVTPTAGSILFDGTDLCQINGERLRQYRKHIQMIFQDPYTSLDPLMKVGDIVVEPLLVLGIMRDRRLLKAEAERVLELVQLNPSNLGRYPNELSGGQRQRVAIARAIVLKPHLIVCDEPVSALDAFTQSRITEILLGLQEQFSLAYLFISHDVAAVRYMSDTIAVMYLGELVELAESQELCAHPRHPYTQALISAVPVANPLIESSRQRTVLPGEVPSPLNPPPGCKFNPRCNYRKPGMCDREEPREINLGNGHFVRCHRYA